MWRLRAMPAAWSAQSRTGRQVGGGTTSSRAARVHQPGNDDHRSDSFCRHLLVDTAFGGWPKVNGRSRREPLRQARPRSTIGCIRPLRRLRVSGCSLVPRLGQEKGGFRLRTGLRPVGCVARGETDQGVAAKGVPDAGAANSSRRRRDPAAPSQPNGRRRPRPRRTGWRRRSGVAQPSRGRCPADSGDSGVGRPP